ncbi:MAG: ABC transporter ATP-binding protein, partial [Faecalibacterium prausnitzii]|nr:ABC transporter ATP-binding protein [Faecalibacterium prausnitzii]
QEPVYENEKIKQQIFYISDGGYFPQGYTAANLKDFYREYYPDFMTDRYSKLMDQFHLDEKRRISSYSKGMKKQLLVIMGISAGTKYLLCDETFDGLDPVMRQAVKSLFVSEIMNRDFTPVIASHNMRELEDVCDHVGLLHKGGILLSRELEDMKFHIHKIQCVLKPGVKVEDLTSLDILKTEYRGSLATITVRGTRENVEQQMAACEPLFFELIPLSLEEIFISETEVAGYDIKKLIF